MIWIVAVWLLLNVAQFFGFRALMSHGQYATAFWSTMLAVAVDVAFIAFAVKELGTTW